MTVKDINLFKGFSKNLKKVKKRREEFYATTKDVFKETSSHYYIVPNNKNKFFSLVQSKFSKDKMGFDIDQIQAKNGLVRCGAHHN